VADGAHVTDEAIEAEAVNKADDTKVDEADEADEAEAEEAIVAEEAVVADKANNASVAKADKANEANKAGEAEAVDEAEADEANDEANRPNEAGEAKANEAVEIKADEADMAIEADWAYEFDKLNKANKAVAAVASDVADAVNEANLADKARVTNKAEANEVIVFVKLPVLHPFSLTKCTAIFTEVKGYFGIFNNQLGGLTCWIVLLCSLRNQEKTSVAKNVLSRKDPSNGRNNQLKREVDVSRHCNCWAISDRKQQKICVSRRHNC
jgi:hypothetical protein